MDQLHREEDRAPPVLKPENRLAEAVRIGLVLMVAIAIFFSLRVGDIVRWRNVDLAVWHVLGVAIIVIAGVLLLLARLFGWL